TLLSKGQTALATLRELHQNPLRLFGVDEATGLTKIRTKAGFGGASKHISDIAEHPARYQLSAPQKAYVEQVHRVEDWVLDGLKEAGVDVKLLKFDEFSHWVHREVIGKSVDDALVKIRSKGGGRIGSKATFEKTRFYETAAEGVKAGVLYESSLERVVELYIQSAAKRISDQRIAGMVAHLGAKPLERAARIAPQTLAEAKQTALTLAGARRLVKVISRVARGEKLTEQTLRAQERRFPELGRRLREVMGQKRGKPGISTEQIWNSMDVSDRAVWARQAKLNKTDTWAKLTKGEQDAILLVRNEIAPTVIETKTALKQLAKEANQIIESSRAPFFKAKLARQVLLERARTPTLGTEATIFHPAFQGKIYPKNVVGEIQRYWDDVGFSPLNKLATLSGE
ncbi:hypothetical protein LCGC14_2843410, partial [marine sediment metagenome]